MPLRLAPSPERIAVAYLKAHASISAIVGTRVATDLNTQRPCLTVNLVTGETVIPQHLTRPLLQVSAWGTTQDQADLLMRTAVAVMEEAWTVDHDRGVVCDARVAAGPRWLPDTSVNPPTPRYITDFLVVMHPHPL